MIKETFVVIKADEGMVLTDGEIYGNVIVLPKDRTEDEFNEISEEEYQAIMEETKGEEYE